MFNNTTNTNKRKREENINSFQTSPQVQPVISRQMLSQTEDNSVKTYKIYVGKYIHQLYHFKDTIESIYNVKLTYEIDENITISYIKQSDLTYVLETIDDLRKNIVIDKSKIYKAKISIEDDELSFEQTLLLERLRDYMETPSVSYEFLDDKIILRGPDDQLMTFIDEYNKLVEDDYIDLNIINPIIYKKYKKYKN